MIDFRDFMQKAEYDLDRSMYLFKIEDYGFAAYSIQQALEKYLKAYLLKFNLVTEVHKLGHLQYFEILKEAITILENQKNDEKDENIIRVLESTIEHFTTLQTTFKKVEQSHDYKILFWKSSLGIKLNKNEQNILNGIRIKNNTSTKKYLSVLHNYLGSPEFLANLLKKKIPVKLKSKLPLFIIDYLNAIKNNDQKNAKLILEKFMLEVKPYFYGTGPNSLSKDATDFMIKMKMIDTAFEWYEYGLLTFPHQEIGRYPTIIENTNSEILYEENKDKLLQLIQSITIICNKIKGICH
ncbi:MAG: HEPN domain-containing protein [Nitrosopumilus sp.]|uniref:HEPN domain-containing protein n=1 Tax=Nitrosopumilus sp. TaxID=2024843 RepID=UPI00247D4983|nr:HEPN domain-containing protein [Nitrosopumilus sp.]MCV0392002.1 HEPN domain-containing protein [Nitrosopumilus sp.]